MRYTDGTGPGEAPAYAAGDDDPAVVSSEYPEDAALDPESSRRHEDALDAPAAGEETGEGVHGVLVREAVDTYDRVATEVVASSKGVTERADAEEGPGGAPTSVRVRAEDGDGVTRTGERLRYASRELSPSRVYHDEAEAGVEGVHGAPVVPVPEPV